MSIFEYNGSAVVAIKGENCVAIAADTRLGRQQLTISTRFQKIFRIHDKLYIALGGLATDIQTVSVKLQSMHKMYVLKEGRKMSPRVFAHAVSNLLYSHRFGPWFLSPVIAGLDDKNEPYVATMDSIGALDAPDNDLFVASGTTGDELTGIAESLTQPGMDPETLFNTTAQVLLNAVDRDCLAGWGSEVVLLTPEKGTKRTIRSRMD